MTYKLNVAVQSQIREFKGPSMKDRWLYWQSITPEQQARSATIDELEKLNKSFDVGFFILYFPLYYD